MSDWKTYERIKFNPFKESVAPFDGVPFLARIWNEWTGLAIYARHYHASDQDIPGKYEFFYITNNPEEEGWQVRLDIEECPITHWMPLPESPKS